MMISNMNGYQRGVNDRGVDKEIVLYTYSGILLSHKKIKYCHLPPTWLNLDIVRVNEVSQRKTNI